MSSDPQSAAIHTSAQPTSQPALAAASQPPLPASTAALVAPSAGLPAGIQGATPVMTNAQLTQGLLGIIQRLEALHDGQQALLAGQPGLQQPLLPSSSSRAASLSRPTVPHLSAAALAIHPPAGVPIHMVSFPPSPLPIPSWTVGPPPPLYSSNTPITTVMPLSSAAPTAPAAVGGIPAAGTIYDGVDGPLSTSIPGSYMAGGAPPPDRMSPAPEGDRPPPKFYKLEFPTYDGSEDPLPWLTHCEQFFRG
jgi:hypothetical protein